MLALDHIIIAASSPEQAAHNFSERHRIKVAQGGQHANWGTYNYLAYFENDCYIEWIGITDWTVAKESDNPLIQLLVRKLSNGVEGPVQYALRTERMDDCIENLKTLDTPYTGPFPGSRKRPDGRLLEWRMLFPASAEDVLPF